MWSPAAAASARLLLAAESGVGGDSAAIATPWYDVPVGLDTPSLAAGPGGGGALLQRFEAAVRTEVVEAEGLVSQLRA